MSRRRMSRRRMSCRRRRSRRRRNFFRRRPCSSGRGHQPRPKHRHLQLLQRFTLFRSCLRSPHQSHRRLTKHKHQSRTAGLPSPHPPRRHPSRSPIPTIGTTGATAPTTPRGTGTATTQRGRRGPHRRGPSPKFTTGSASRSGLPLGLPLPGRSPLRASAGLRGRFGLRVATVSPPLERDRAAPSPVVLKPHWFTSLVVPCAAEPLRI